MTPYDKLRVLLALVPEGEQGEKQVCPFCGGGSSGEVSLDIYRHSATSGAYQCKRANCGKEGYIGERFTTNWSPEGRKKPKEFEPRFFTGSIEEVPEYVRDIYQHKYGWTREEFDRTGCGWSPTYNRTVWKIVAPDGTLRGIELRSHDAKDRAKTLHYRHTADPWVGYVGIPEGGISKRLIAVEDLVSAYRVAESGYPAASIMGSHLSFDIMIDLMKVSETIVLCLDRDATAKAEKFAKRYAFICPGLIHVPLQRDLKYESPENIKAILDYAIC